MYLHVFYTNVIYTYRYHSGIYVSTMYLFTASPRKGTHTYVHY